MKLQTFSLALSSLVALANAATWQFNVVSIAGTAFDMGIKYENKVTKMTSEIYPLYTTKIESGASKTYKYVLIDKSGKVVQEESFERTYQNSVSSTNEVYNRKPKNVKVPSLPKAFKPLYSDGTEEFVDYPNNQIYTLYAKCDEAPYTDIKHNPFLPGTTVKNEQAANCTLNLITPNEVFVRDSTVQLVGFNSRLFKKLSFKFKLDKKLFGRKTLKVRALASDPTLLRDKLSAELFRSVGVPSYSGTYVRVMINEDVWGLYSIVDTIGGKWIAANIHGDDEARVGYNYKMYSSVPNGPYASLRYLGENPDKYEYSGSYEADEVDKDDTVAKDKFYRLAQFTKMFENWVKTYGNDQSQAAVDALKKFFDLESLLRQMVIESLTLAYDNFWAQLGNYAVYYNPEKNKYQIIPYDFDGTFYGSNESPFYKSDYLTDCISWADKTLPDKYFVNNILKHDLIKKRYNLLMDKILKTVFNVKAISGFIDGVSDLIRDDIEWNFNLIDQLDSNIPGHVNHFTLKNFEDNINYKRVDYNAKLNYNDAHYGLKQWVKVRGGNCSKYVSSVIGENETAVEEPIVDQPNIQQPAIEKPVTITATTTTTTVKPKPTITKIVTTTQKPKPKPTTTKVVVATQPPKPKPTTSKVVVATQPPKPKPTTSKVVVTTQKPKVTTTTTNKKVTTTTVNKNKKTIVKVITVKKVVTIKKKKN